MTIIKSATWLTLAALFGLASVACDSTADQAGPAPLAFPGPAQGAPGQDASATASSAAHDLSAVTAIDANAAADAGPVAADPDTVASAEPDVVATEDVQASAQDVQEPELDVVVVVDPDVSSVEPPCEPVTCTGLGLQCGSADDGCGGTLDCGGCDAAVNGVSACVSGVCTLSCVGGFAKCGVSCVDLMADNVNCGACNNPCDGTCDGGSCVPHLDVVILQGADQVVMPGEALPQEVIARVSTPEGEPVAGIDVVVAPPPGAVATAVSLTTDAAGEVRIAARAGVLPGRYEYLTSVPGVESSFAATALQPPSHTITSFVNGDHLPGDQGVPGPAVAARVGNVHSVIVAPSGTVYFTDVGPGGHKIRAVSPNGMLSDVAGVHGSPGFAGDGGSALTAKFNLPSGLAVDEEAGMLYVADWSNNRVRRVNLGDGLVETVAGGGNTGADPTFGDGLAASEASLDDPSHVVLRDGLLVISDSGHDRVRALDLEDGTISTLVEGVRSTYKCADRDDALVLASCEDGCPVASDSFGQLFIAGRFACGGTDTVPSGATPGVARMEADGTLTRVAGIGGSTQEAGIPATLMTFGPIRGMAFDPAGNLFLTKANQVVRIDGATYMVEGVAGGNHAGAEGDGGPGEDATFNAPHGLAFTADGRLLVADKGNASVRSLWQIASWTTSTASLAASYGTEQYVLVGSEAGSMGMLLVDADYQPLGGVTLSFDAPTPGAAALTPVLLTDAQTGLAEAAGLVGLAEGTYTFAASYRDLHGAHAEGSPVTFVAHAVAPASGHILTALNASFVPGDEGIRGPSGLAQVYQTHGVTTDAAGNIYVSAWNHSKSHRVVRIDSVGVVTPIAGGKGSSGYAGDGGPGAEALLSRPYGLAVDDTTQMLYLADNRNNVVRRVDLVTGDIETYAGGGSDDETLGDGAAPLEASFDKPTHLALDMSGQLFVTDSGNNRVRVIDTQSDMVDSVLVGSSSTPLCADAPILRACSTGCALATREGSVYVSGRFSCGGVSAAGAPKVPAIVRIDPDGTVSRVAGFLNGPLEDGAPALEVGMKVSEGLAFNSLGDLFYTDGHMVRRILASTGLVDTVAGNGGAGDTGDFGPATAASLDVPFGLSVHPAGHILIADKKNAALRMVWGPLP